MVLQFSLIILFFLQLTEPPVFKPQTIDDQVEIGYGLAIGDVDGDGKPDILMADKKQFVWYRNGDWKKFVMAENLTSSDNVCITARDIDGDGRVEVAVGAQWNPSEVSDPDKSGSVHYLIRPEDPTLKWSPVQLHHEPTVHRMRWVKADTDRYHLVVLPLHGRGNTHGEGNGVNVIAYEMPDDPTKDWKHWVIDDSMHLTHNLDLVEEGNGERILIGGKEGVRSLSFLGGEWKPSEDRQWMVQNRSFGEVRMGEGTANTFLAGIEPMHGNHLTVYTFSQNSPDPERQVLTSSLNQGHALGVGDLLGLGNQQVVVGWRNPNSEDKVGIKIFIPRGPDLTDWEEHWIDNNGIACEDLQLADLDGDGRMEIIAAGRATQNLKVYWNKE